MSANDDDKMVMWGSKSMEHVVWGCNTVNLSATCPSPVEHEVTAMTPLEEAQLKVDVLVSQLISDNDEVRIAWEDCSRSEQYFEEHIQTYNFLREDLKKQQAIVDEYLIERKNELKNLEDCQKCRDETKALLKEAYLALEALKATPPDAATADLAPDAATADLAPDAATADLAPDAATADQS